MRRTHSVSELIAALFVLFVSLSCATWVYFNFVHSSEKMIIYKAEFDTASGLSVGSPVKINGVTVGSVQKIRLAPKRNYNAVVVFSVEKRVVVPDDSEASITSESFLGEKIMTLTLGSSATPLAPDDVILHTHPSLSIEELLQRFLFANKDSDKEDKKDENGKDEKSDEGTKDDNSKDDVSPDDAVNMLEKMQSIPIIF